MACSALTEETKALLNAVSCRRRAADLYEPLRAVCHEVRNHLNGARLALDLARCGAPEEVPGFLDEMRARYDSLAVCFEDFVALFRPIVLTPTPNRVGQLVNDLAGSWRTRLCDRGSSLGLEAPRPDPTGEFDACQLMEVLDLFALWRIGGMPEGLHVRVSWWEQEDRLHLHWHEHPSPSDEKGPVRLRDDVGQELALCRLARVVALHGGQVAVWNRGGFGMEMIWPSRPFEEPEPVAPVSTTPPAPHSRKRPAARKGSA